jgi:polysaccharide export outer membrane protein
VSSSGHAFSSPYNSGGQKATDGFTPAFDSKQQETGAPPTGAVRDAGATSVAESIASVTKPGSKAYRIGPLDVLDFNVFQAPELTRSVEVDETGMIDLPLIGEMPAAGKTTQELQRDVTAKLGAKYLQNPDVNITIKEFNSSRVTVSGAVKTPGVFPYKGETLMQYVSMAGGVTPESNSMILVLRQDGGKRSAGKFNLADIQTGRAEDPKIQSGDVIVADTSAVKRGLNNILKVLPLAGFAALL